MKHFYYMSGILFFFLFCSGCVERIITITSEPPGALVWLNGEEVGATPTTVTFTWYGEYEVMLRKEDYDTLKTTRNTPRPIYQYPGLDFFSEAVVPITCIDRHEWHFDLASATSVETDGLIDRAQRLRQETVSGE